MPFEGRGGAIISKNAAQYPGSNHFHGRCVRGAGRRCRPPGAADRPRGQRYLVRAIHHGGAVGAPGLVPGATGIQGPVFSSSDYTHPHRVARVDKYFCLFISLFIACFLFAVLWPPVECIELLEERFLKVILGFQIILLVVKMNRTAAKKKRRLLCLNLRRTSNEISLHNNMNRSSPLTTCDHPWLVTEC